MYLRVYHKHNLFAFIHCFLQMKHTLLLCPLPCSLSLSSFLFFLSPFHSFTHTHPSPRQNVLRHYMVELVSASLRWVGTVRNPTHYFVLLRHLFRGIGGGKFEVLYKVRG